MSVCVFCDVLYVFCTMTVLTMTNTHSVMLKKKTHYSEKLKKAQLKLLSAEISCVCMSSCWLCI